VSVQGAGDEPEALLLVRVAGPHPRRRLAAWLKRGWREHGVKVEDNRDLQAELARLRQLVEALSARLAARAEVLQKRAEKPSCPARRV
jgi:hypothetical protein